MFSIAKPVLAVANRSPSADYLAANLGDTLHIFHLSKDTIVTHKEDLNLTSEPDLQVYQRVNLYDPRVLRQLEGNQTYLEAAYSIDLKRALVYQKLAARVPEQQDFITREQFGIYQRNPPPRGRFHWNRKQYSPQYPPRFRQPRFSNKKSNKTFKQQEQLQKQKSKQSRNIEQNTVASKNQKRSEKHLKAEPKAEASNLQALVNSEKKYQTEPETISEHLDKSEQKDLEDKQFSESENIETFTFSEPEIVSTIECDCGRDHREVSYSAETLINKESDINLEDKAVRDKIILEAETAERGFDETDSTAA